MRHREFTLEEAASTDSLASEFAISSMSALDGLQQQRSRRHLGPQSQYEAWSCEFECVDASAAMPLNADKTSTSPQANRLRIDEFVAGIARLHRKAVIRTEDNIGREAVKNPVPRIRRNPRTQAINQPESEKSGMLSKPFSERVLRMDRMPRKENSAKNV